MNTWNSELVFKLIDLFQEKPELWDPSSEDYRDRDKKQESWCEIAKALDIDHVIVEKKIRMLMTQYRRELNRKRSSKWFAFQKLAFLNARQTARKTKSTTPGPADGSATYYISLAPQLDEKNHDNNLQYDNPNGQRKEKAVLKDIIISDFVETTRRDRKQFQKDSSTHKSTSQEATNTKIKDNERKGKDEYAMYGELVAMKLRKIGSGYARSTAQFHINNILYKAEIGTYDKHPKRKRKSSHLRESFVRAGSSSPQHFDVNYDDSQSSSASKPMEDVLKLENDDSDE